MFTKSRRRRGKKKLIIILNLAQFWSPQLVSQTTAHWFQQKNWHNLSNIWSQALPYKLENVLRLLFSCCCPLNFCSSSNKTKHTTQDKPRDTLWSTNRTSDEDTRSPFWTDGRTRSVCLRGGSFSVYLRLQFVSNKTRKFHTNVVIKTCDIKKKKNPNIKITTLLLLPLTPAQGFSLLKDMFM